MKTTLPLNLIRLSLFLALYPTGQLRAELKEHPWVLERHGAYVEMTEGAFLRLSAIERVKAVLNVRCGRSEAFERVDASFPLNLFYTLTPNGISEFKALDRDRVKLADGVWDVRVLVYINGELNQLVSWRGDDFLKNWDELETAIFKARSQVMKLLSLASNG